MYTIVVHSFVCSRLVWHAVLPLVAPSLAAELRPQDDDDQEDQYCNDARRQEFLLIHPIIEVRSLSLKAIRELT